MEKKACKDCGKPPAPNRLICYTCKSRRYTAKNRPLLVWHWIKKSARRRGLEFDLPRDWFFAFLKNSGYIQNSGRLRDQLSIDRINGNAGYVRGNLQVI